MSLTVEKCLQAWTNSLKQMQAKADIVFFGDSLIYYGDFSKLFSDKIVCNLGLRGDTLRGMINRVDQVCFLNPKSVYILAGINDVSLMSPEEFGELYSLLLDILSKSLTRSELVIHTMSPVNTHEFSISCNNNQIRRCNESIKHIANNLGLRLVDLFAMYEEKNQLPPKYTTDGIHLSILAYNLWYKVLLNNG